MMLFTLGASEAAIFSPSRVLVDHTRVNPSVYLERPTEMEGWRNLTFLSTSDVEIAVKRSNRIRIWGAEVKAALGLILVEPSIDELAPFVHEVGHGH